MHTATTTVSSIGWDRQTLREMLVASEDAFSSTGHYGACERLEMKEGDPILYEKLHSRVRGGVVSARENAKRIAASPLVAQMGELCFSLCTPEGDTLALSTGIIVHVQTMSEAIKYMIRHDYETNPGIKDGDIFVNNDPQISNVHCADVQTFVPIFYEGELISWAASVTHEFDVGASAPGSNSVGPINRFEDGIDLPAMRCGENDRLFADYVGRCTKAVRSPLYWTLDEKTRIAGCHILRKLVLGVVADHGIDAYKQFVREAVEDGRRSFVERIREQLVPGTYRASVFMDYQFSQEAALPEEAAVDELFHVPVKVTVAPEGRLDISLQGANSWGYHSFNCTPVAMRGGLWALLAQTLMSNDKVNAGSTFAVSLDLPHGSWSNPGHHLTAHGNSWLTLVPFANALARPLSRGYQSRGYVEEVIAGWPHGTCLQGGQLSEAGVDAAFSNLEICCLGAGAGVVQDGLDYASCSWFPTADMGDIEDWESSEPLLYLGRTVKQDSAGLGRRRGGLGFESLRMVWVDMCRVQSFGEGLVACQAGLFGGYPAPSGYRHTMRNTNLPELFSGRQPYPVADWEPGEFDQPDLPLGADELRDKRSSTLLARHHRHDLYLSVSYGGPGLGDPLARPVDAIQRDLDADTMSSRLAAAVCGAEIREDGDGAAHVDAVATADRRDELRRDRARRATPVREWMQQEREARVVPRDVIEPVARMYRSAMELSPEWAGEYREFWDLPKDFVY